MPRAAARGRNRSRTDRSLVRTSSHRKPPYLRASAKLPAQILYVGTAPSLVNGALQINILLPKELIGGPAVPIQISVGNYTSPPGTTLAVK